MHFVCFLYADYILICILSLHYSLPNSSPLHVRRSKAHLLGPHLLNDRPPSRWNSIARLVFKGLWKMAFFCAFKFFAGRQRGQVNRKGKGRSLEIIDEEDGHILCVAWPLPPQPRFGPGGGGDRHSCNRSASGSGRGSASGSGGRGSDSGSGNFASKTFVNLAQPEDSSKVNARCLNVSLDNALKL